MITHERMQECSKIIQEFRDKCNPKYENITDIYWDRGTEGTEIVCEIHVKIEQSEDAYPGSDTYCYPVANFGRKHGLFLWDTGTDWENETVTLRFRFQD